MSRFVIALIATMIVLPAAAQDSGSAQESSAASSSAAPPQGVSGKAAFGYLATSGNTQSTNTNASLALDYVLPNWRHGFDISAVAASSNEETTAEAYLFDYEARRAFGANHFLFTALDFKRDRFSGYREQVSQTVGYGRRLVARERHVLDGGLGFGARQSELQDGTEEDDAIVRGTMSYFWTMTDTTEFEQSLVVESGSTNTSFESRSALRARIIGDISLVLSYRFKHNSNVPPEAENADRFSSIALEYAF